MHPFPIREWQEWAAEGAQPSSISGQGLQGALRPAYVTPVIATLIAGKANVIPCKWTPTRQRGTKYRSTQPASPNMSFCDSSVPLPTVSPGEEGHACMHLRSNFLGTKRHRLGTSRVSILEQSEGQSSGPITAASPSSLSGPVSVYWAERKGLAPFHRRK